MAIRRTLAQFSDEIVAADIAADAVGASELANDAVAAANIIDGSVGTSEMAAGIIGVKPHIIPDVLYPAVSNVMLDGTTALSAVTTGPNSSTVASSKYGTVQSDGRMYYYTDIKGSKPIKDARIGSHFGSQRHKFKSVQILEQETATHGKNVYSVDGRENIRGSGDGDITFNMGTDSSNGMLVLTAGKNSYIEIVGYFSDMNVISYNAANRDVRYTLDGATENTTDYGSATVGSPLTGRYVDSAGLTNFGLGATLGIHTVKITSKEAGENVYLFGIELIAQDTTSTATKSQIQIPSQNVVSYGKKFTVAETKHYNPFAFKTDGSTAWASGAHNGTAWPIGTGSSTNIDTATSLGLSAWVSTNYYKPYNGGRVVKWVASDGTIKTSVNMMPPNARNISSTASNEKANAAVANTQPLPTFSDDAIDHSQAEVAKTFHVREFGNGAANGGTLSGTYADASMISATDDIAYVMDDGLSSFGGEALRGQADGGIYIETDDKKAYLTFIGTGLSVYDDNDDAWETWAQNLPYGTHIMEYHRNATTENSTVKIDGVQIKQEWLYWREFTFHQPKMPPIPEDACIIADYMLMADFVPQTGTATNGHISKGVRACAATRDGFIDATADSWSVSLNLSYMNGYYLGPTAGAGSDTTHTWRMPAFATNYVVRGWAMDTRAKLFIGTTDKDSASTRDNTANGGGYSHLTSDEVLGVQNWGANAASGQNPYFSQMEFATPIHTSSHYQTFETPFLHELVGGDRNMEQNNLVVTSDGKTWDEVTRDTSYIGNCVLQATGDTATSSSSTVVILDEWRGGRVSDSPDLFNKDWAIAYDRLICMKTGQYEITVETLCDTNGIQAAAIYLNGTIMSSKHTSSGGGAVGFGPATNSNVFNLHRGDYIQIKGDWYDNTLHNSVRITRV